MLPQNMEWTGLLSPPPRSTSPVIENMMIKIAIVTRTLWFGLRRQCIGVNEKTDLTSVALLERGSSILSSACDAPGGHTAGCRACPHAHQFYTSWPWYFHLYLVVAGVTPCCGTDTPGCSGARDRSQQSCQTPTVATAVTWCSRTWGLNLWPDIC